MASGASQRMIVTLKKALLPRGFYVTGSACQRDINTSMAQKRKNGPKEIESKIQRKSNRYLEKMIQRNHKISKWHMAPSPMFTKKEPSGTNARRSPWNEKRAQTLSVILYGYVSSLLTTGEVDESIPDLGIEVCKVKMAPDMSGITVYWLATGTKKDDLVQEILENSSGKLRTILTSMRIMGYLPPIHFVKELSQVRLQEVEKLLKIADMGPDHEETPLAEDQKEEKVMPRNISLQERISELTDKFDQVDQRSYLYGEEKYGAIEILGDNPYKDHKSTKQNTIGDTVPDQMTEKRKQELNFRSDLYDLDHTKLMQKVQHTKRKSEDRNYLIPDAEHPREYTSQVSFTQENIAKLIKKNKEGKKIRQLRHSVPVHMMGLDQVNDDQTYDNVEQYEDEDCDYDDSDDIKTR